jgi:hypothetical protein
VLTTAISEPLDWREYWAYPLITNSPPKKWFPTMQVYNERWQQLCEQAVKEQDSEKFLALIEEINRLLTEKEERLRAVRATDAPDKPS